MKEHALIVDLDGSLIRQDCLITGIKIEITKNFFRAFYIFYLGIISLPKLKEHIALRDTIKPHKLNYNAHVLKYIEKWKTENLGKVYLISGSHLYTVEKIASHLQIFDGFYGTTDKINLVGIQKLRLIQELYPRGNFDYIGNSRSDIIIWGSSSQKICVSTSKPFRKKLKKLFKTDVYFLD